MLEIEKLLLRLPAGFEHRGASIARLLGERLGAIGALPGGRIDSLTVPLVRPGPNASDGEIASLVADGIVTQISGSAGRDRP